MSQDWPAAPGKTWDKRVCALQRTLSITMLTIHCHSYFPQYSFQLRGVCMRFSEVCATILYAVISQISTACMLKCWPKGWTRGLAQWRPLLQKIGFRCLILPCGEDSTIITSCPLQSLVIMVGIVPQSMLLNLYIVF